ncbi:MAG TPA: polysaccharide deacetylase family protein [Thermoanaerobaculia bacterium]|jgi:peptidoglycan/xylan/chitin deacetylase (PgdA/CDA1 family)
MSLGPITAKRALKRAAGWAAVLTSPWVARPERPRACILMYHRVAAVGFVDPRLDDWNVPPATFATHMAALADFAECVPLRELPARLRAPEPPRKPLVCVTFDDGYANFVSSALPALERYRVPASCFVVTSCVATPDPMPFDRWAQRHGAAVPPEAWRSADWAALERALASGLVTVGSHSHRHRDGSGCGAEALAEEAGTSREILLRRLGPEAAAVYAYPYGCSRLGHVSDAYVGAVRAAGYSLAVTTDLGLADAASDVYRLPRIEANPLDSAAVLRAKVRGALLPYLVTDRLRKARRAA